ncbi:hypothetical protein ADUPG1_005530, partial [Aduncisulcus paluster]
MLSVTKDVKSISRGISSVSELVGRIEGYGGRGRRGRKKREGAATRGRKLSSHSATFSGSSSSAPSLSLKLMEEMDEIEDICIFDGFIENAGISVL